MSRFDETVQKIAESPWKRRLFRELPRLLQKEAAPRSPFRGQRPPTHASPMMERMFGVGGGQDIAKDITKNIGTAAILGLGGYGGARLMGELDDSADKSKARFTALGKLEAEQAHRQRQLEMLNPLHTRTYEALQSDPILAKADPDLIRSSFETMRKFAPNLASDPNATRAFLQESALYGKGPSYATLKTLADAEGAVMKTMGGGGN